MKEKFAFVGSGMIGAGLAVNALLSGHPCTVYDVIPVEQIKKNVEKVMDMMVMAEAVSRSAADEGLALASCTGDLKEAVSGAAFVQECVPERLDLKRSIYRQIQELTGPDTIIASSTSALMPSVLQEGALYPQSILVCHPYNPSYLLPLIEVCGGKETSAETVQRAMTIYAGIGKAPVHCRKEANGFIVNSLSWGAMEAAKKAVLDGVCTVKDMDKAIMYGPGMRMAVTGQIMTMSLGIQGGLRAAAAKYGKEPDEADCILADGVEDAMAHRTQAQGRDEESVIRFRDKMFAGILKLHKKFQ